ncbi:MAG: glycerate kinase [Candidatus Acidiferrales bacterium]
MPDLKQLARRIFHETLAAIDIHAAFRRKLNRSGATIYCGEERVDLAPFRGIRAIAIGKAAVAMARGLTDALAPEFSVEGILVAPGIASPVPHGFRAIVAGHPVPNEGSFQAARAILDLLARCDETTVVFFLLSGGGSALVELPLDPKVTLADVRGLYRVLVTCGASIDEINAVRKHLSAVKGGRLAVAAPRALKLTFGVSDVPAGRESALASGPTLPDPTTIDDAREIVERFALLGKLPASIRAKFAPGGDLPETPKAGDHAFRRAHFALLLGMDDLFHPAHRAAEAAGCVTICDNSTDDWPVARAAEYLLAQLERLRDANPGRRVAVIADGELSSPVSGDGVGGRNSAFVLECAQRIAGKGIAVLSAGTDGVDGSSPAAGAVADGTTLARAEASQLDPADFAQRSDSYSFFNALGDAIVTGPTGNNLRDLRILLAE